jgi:cytochrome P450
MTDGITLHELSGSHHQAIERLRRVGPVVWVDVLRAWMVLDRTHALAVLRDPARFTVDEPRFSTAQVVGPSMLSLDGPAHRRHREPFVSAFRPTVVLDLFAPVIRAEAVALVERMRPAGRGDLRAGLAGPLAARSAAMLIGLDSIGPTMLLGWYRRIVAATEALSVGAADDEALRSARRAMDALRAALVDVARDDGSPLHDAASALDEDELVANAAVFLFGGIETTEGMIANLFHTLLADPGLLATVLADRSALDTVIEESLRVEPAVARVDRYATGPVELGAAHIAAGDAVIVSLAAANRDPAWHVRPAELRLDRTTEPGHLTFVHGPHACIGAQVARAEARAAVDAVLDRLPGLAAVHPLPPVEGVVFRKPSAVPAQWSAVSRVDP